MQAYTAINRASGYSYDAAGNMLSDGLTNTLAYDANGMVSWDSGTTYSYNPVGERVGKAGGGVAATDTVYFGGRPIARLSNGAWTDLVYGPTGLLAEVPGTQNGAPVYRMTDHLGSTVGLLSASGTVMGTQDTVPFGQLLPGGGAQDASFPFTELEHDQESGFDHAQYRQYASNTGRWMSPDPYDGSMDLGNPQTLNRYAYVMNSPLLYTDPSGQDPCSGAATFGFAVGGAPGEAVGIGVCVGEIAYAVAKDIEDILGFFNHPQFHGSTKARPNQPWGDHHIPYNGNLANILGLPDSSCEFGACGGPASSFASDPAYPNGNPDHTLDGLDPFTGLKYFIEAAGQTARTLWYYTSPASCFYVNASNKQPRVGLYGGLSLGVGSVATKGPTAAKYGWAGLGLAAYSVYAYEMTGYCSKKE